MSAANKKHQMNLGFDENNFDQKGGFNHQPLFVVNYFSQQTGERPPNSINQKRSLGLGCSEFENYLSKSKRKKSRNKEESKLKAFYADQLMDLIANEDLNLKLASYKTNLSHEKLIDLSKGNISRVSLYELLSGITAFGCEARICLRPTLHHQPGEVIPDM